MPVLAPRVRSVSTHPGKIALTWILSFAHAVAIALVICQVPDLHEKVLARTPAQRWGTPDDFTGVAIFLGSPASNFITGVAIPVDGGYSIQG